MKRDKQPKEKRYTSLLNPQPDLYHFPFIHNRAEDALTQQAFFIQGVLYTFPKIPVAECSYNPFSADQQGLVASFPTVKQLSNLQA